MAISKQLLNTLTGNKKTVSAEIEVAYIQADEEPSLDFYVKMTVAGADKAGRAIGPFYLTALTDLPDDSGTKQHPSGSTDPFDSLTAQMENYYRHIMEGDAGIPNSALNF